MKVITEEVLKVHRHYMVITRNNLAACVIDALIEECQEIDALTVKETNLILAAEKYAEKYSAEDGNYIKTDVLNAFYHGAEWQRKHKPELTGDGE